jgi:murein DD-endopeptidase MepM/ murein hydrolase activator NlpD
MFGFIAASLVAAMAIVAIAFQYIDSPKEKFLAQQNEDLKRNYGALAERTNQLELQMNELLARDNEVYRSIFESKPIPDSARLKDQNTRKEVQLIAAMGETSLITQLTGQLNDLSLLAAYHQKSLTEVEAMLKNKEALLAHIPAIQPVSNKNLNRIASGFGYRIDPVYKVPKMHAGLDFTAPQGTPIYAAADGVIKKSEYNSSGYGNHVVINHGYGFETLYAHMSRIKSRVGNSVKRGEVIGWVGNTGKSTGPHCHYEVHRNGRPVDPIYYFYNDLTPAQYDRLLKLAAAANQSLD